MDKVGSVLRTGLVRKRRPRLHFKTGWSICRQPMQRTENGLSSEGKEEDEKRSKKSLRLHA